ncbi:MAG: glycosyltransferase, partial [Lachnospiraceae bacterium]|nr:glycosyltransferase [Lachnospiraceae bacterium]
YTEEKLESVMAELVDADMAITQDFSAVVAEACHRLERIYLCWVYDAPQRALYMSEALYETNIIFHFDRMEQTHLQKLGVKHLFHRPLAANISRSSVLSITDEDIRRFSCGISFVGDLYLDAKREKWLEVLPEREKEEAEKWLKEGLGIWKEGAPWISSLDPVIVEKLYQGLDHREEEYYRFTKAEIVSSILTRLQTSRERIYALNCLADRFDTHLYTHHPEESATVLKNVQIHPPVSYDSDQLKVFYSSAINLNITMRSIESGIPQRVFDIMSVGGFVLSNYQPELEECFVPGKELELFCGWEEMEEKAAYYLSHEAERQRIALAGYRKVKERYDIGGSMKEMLKVASQA